jgi:hypothetical protein
MSMNWETFALENNAWLRLQAGWLSGEETFCGIRESLQLTEVAINKLSSRDGVRSAVIRTGNETALVAEYRTQTKYDELGGNPLNTGVLVYKVSGNIPTDSAPISIVKKSNIASNATPSKLEVLALGKAALQEGEMVEVDGVIIALLSKNGKTANIVLGQSSDMDAIKFRTAEIKLKAAADKAAADKAAADKAAADKAAAKGKKLTISCVKGKLIKKVTGVKPLCPSGYKKK